MAHQAMPGGRRIDLTLGASGTTYTAPADGYVFFVKTATAAGQNVRVTCQLQTEAIAQANGNWLRAWIPVRKGDGFVVFYNAGGATQTFAFIYAQGAK